MTKTIFTTCGTPILVSTEDYDWLNSYKWQINNSGYAYRRKQINKKVTLRFMHREILGLKPGDRSMVGEHRNRQKNDNRRENLRKATYTQNGANRIRNRKKHIPKGVYKGKNRFYAKIIKEGIEIHGGGYNTPELAAEAYDLMAIREYKEFACTNYPIENYKDGDIIARLEELKCISRATVPSYKKDYTGGASWFGKLHKFGAWIRLKDGRRTHLGLFNTKQEAERRFEQEVKVLGLYRREIKKRRHCRDIVE